MFCGCHRAAGERRATNGRTASNARGPHHGGGRISEPFSLRSIKPLWLQCDLDEVEMDSLLLDCRRAPDELLAAAGRRRPSRAEAEDAVRTLIGWAGDNP